MPANPTLVTLYNTNLPDNTEGEITPAKLREAFVDTAAEIDTVGDAIVASTNTALAAKASIAYVDAAVEVLQEQIDDFDPGSSSPGEVIEFTTAVPLDKANTIMNKVLTANLTLTEASGKVPGGGATIRIQQEATARTVTFPGTWIKRASSEDISTTDGMVHEVIVYYNGTDVSYTITQLGVMSVTPTLSTPTFSATAASDVQINLTGISYDSDSEVMIIRRATNVGMSANLATIYTGVPKSSHNDTGRTASTQYFYDIQTTATGFTDSARGTGNATTFASGLTQLSTPTLSAAAASTTAITLTLGTVANESSYKLEWSANGSTGWTQIGGTIAANTTTYNHTGLTPNTAYFYRLTAVGDGVTYSDSGYGTDDATTNALTQLATPTLTATVVSDTEIDLDWTNVANESSFKLERSLNGTTGWTQIGGTISANTLAYSDTGLTASTHYYYRVSAIGDGSTYSTSGFGTDDDTTDAAAVSNPGYAGVGDSFLYMKADPANLSLTGSAVNTWTNLTGNNATATTTARPTYVAASAGVPDHLIFDGVANRMDISTLAIPSGVKAISGIIVFQQVAAGSPSIMAELGTNGTAPGSFGIYKDYSTNHNMLVAAMGNADLHGAAKTFSATDWTWAKFRVDFNAASNECYVEVEGVPGTTVIAGTNNTGDFATALSFHIGARGNNTAWSNVRIALLTAHSRIFTSGDDAAIAAAIATDFPMI